MSEDRTAISRLLGSKESCCERRGELGAEEPQSREAKLTSGCSRAICSERLLLKVEEQVCKIEESRVSFARVQNYTRERDVPSARLVV